MQYRSYTHISAAVSLLSCALISACGGGGGGSSETSATAAPSTGAAVSSASAAEGSVVSAAASPDAKAVTLDAKSSIDTTSVKAGIAAAVIRALGNTGTSATRAAAAASLTAATSEPPASTTATSSQTAASSTAASTELAIYVESSGSDSLNGATQVASGSDGPVKTIGRAQQLARAKLIAMQSGSMSRATVRIIIGPGEYALANTLYFGPSDAGISGYPVVYEARQAGTVVISGATDLGSKTAPASATPVSYAAPADAAAMNGAGQLFVNGRRAILARQPNAGSAWFVQKPVTLSSDATGSEGKEAFAPAASDLAWMNGLSAADKKRAVVEVMQAWSSGRHRLSDQAAPAGSVRIAPSARWKFLSFGVSQRYYVENVPAALDASGEWIYDSGSIRYIRRDDEAGTAVRANLPLLDKLFVIAGDSSKNVQSLYFRGLKFAYTRYLTPDTGFTDGQAVLTINAAITIDKARDVIFDGCEISKTAGWGIWLREGVRDTKIINSSLTDLGAGGVKVGLSTQSPTDPNATGNNIVANTVIAETGKVFPGAPAVWLGQTWDNQVLRNTVYNTSYTAISVGWTWGYQDARSGRNLIQANLIYNIGQRQLSDMAAIYTLGRSPGTTITNNIIRSVRGYIGYGAGSWGIYNDEGTTGVVMENNVILGTDSGAYHLHYGKDNILQKNLMSGGDSAEIRVTEFEANANISVVNNLLAPKTLQPFDRYAEAPGVIFTGNEATPTLSGPGLLLSKCGTGCSLGTSSINSTTSPTDVRSSNTTFASVISTAASAWSNSTVSTEQAARISAYQLPPVNDAPTAVIVPYVADIGGSADGSRPANMVYVPRDNTTSIRVETRPDMPAGKCLVFNDAATYANRWEPFAYATLSHLSGTTVVEFDVKIDSTTNLRNEWRDDAGAYLTGPTMQITPAGVDIGGTIVALMPVGVPTKFRITTSLGGNSTGTWKLEVTPEGQAATVVDGLAFKDPNWRKLNWLGFVSDAATTSKPCIATLKATNTPPPL